MTSKKTGKVSPAKKNFAMSVKKEVEDFVDPSDEMDIHIDQEYEEQDNNEDGGKG